MKSFVMFAAAFAVAATPLASFAAPRVCAECVKANMEILTGDAMRGRACGTEDEHAAARFVAERLKSYGVKGAGAGGAHLQAVQLMTPTFASPPTLEVGPLRFTQGAEIAAIEPPETFTGKLVVARAGDPPSAVAGQLALYDRPYERAAVSALLEAGAAMVITAPQPRLLDIWDELADSPPGETVVVGQAKPAKPGRRIIFAKPEAIAALLAQDGATARFAAPRGPARMQTTHNVLGVIPGKAAGGQAILLSAHYDHVGVRGGAIYRGANDDASGTAAVLELARVLAKEKRPKRTVQLALFGCEEQGGHGAKYFLAHPPLPLVDIAANLQFEMIGLPDPQRPKTLMLTGWERSNLGPALKAQGADIGPDLYPQQNFFQRSDNYQLALKGVVAQTVSAWPTPPTYHQATDDLASIDLTFMTQVIQSMVKPVQWLLNSDFRPEWNAGMKP